ncbi:MAG: LuxR C-terminal-related transcriptional regulator [Anaerolineales bacterium]
MIEKLNSGRSNNLPIPVSTFIGREKEIVTAKGLILENRLVTITGAGGSGKTRLALQIAHGLLKNFYNNVWFVELASLTDPSHVSQKIASTLEIREQSNQPLLDSIVNYLSTRPSLLVLDNCEHLIEGSAEVADTLLQKCVDLKILTTSREGLGITGEVTWVVPPLSLPELQPWRGPDSARDSLKQYEKSESVQLFIARATAISPEFKLTRNNGAWVAEICRRLDGMPLAIELAAARVRTLSVQEIAERLDDRFGLLTVGSRTAATRHQTLAATIEWSYTLLTEKEQKLLQRLSVFLGGGTLKAIESVCMGNDINKSEVLDTLSQLVDKSLVVANRRSGKNRYSLLETIREYAFAKLAQSNELGTIQNHHLDFFIQFAGEAELGIRGPDEIIWYERLEEEHDNLRSALGWAFESQNSEAGLRLSSKLGIFWFVRGYSREGVEWLERAVAQRQGASTATQAAVIKALCGQLIWSENPDRARLAQLLEESLNLYKKLEDKAGVAWILQYMGVVELFREESDKAEQLFSKSLALRKEVGDPWCIALTLQNFPTLAMQRNNYASAKEFAEETISWFQRAGYQRGIARTLLDLAEIALHDQEYIKANDLLTQSLSYFVKIRDNWSVAFVLELFATLASKLGNFERAAKLFGASESIREMIGMPRHGYEDAVYEKDVTVVRNNLSETVLTQAWEAGRDMTLEQVIEFVSREPDSPSPVQAETERVGGLTQREWEAAVLIAKGKSNREIAEAMTVTVKTVEAYVTRILRKLGFDSRVQVATWVIDNDLS